MKSAMKILSGLILVSFTWIVAAKWTAASMWSIPAGGNAFQTAPNSKGDGLKRDGGLTWGDSDDVYSFFLHVDRPAKLDLALSALVPKGVSELSIRFGKQLLSISLEGSQLANHDLGSIEVSEPGYVRIDIQGKERSGKIFAEVRDLIISSDTKDLVVDYVKNNEGNMFYWGRRGPSVHLTYGVPKDRKLVYGYTEINVPPGQDPVGSYFMANGFAEGYFGIQVNSPTERRVLFSVWSPFQTDNPRDIPKDQRIVTLSSGPDVHVGQFGNEGSGGQSYMIFPWEASKTYRFLTEVKPGTQGTTDYTCWFGETTDDKWRLIASFRRPKTETYLRGFHSFLESFDPKFGHIGRRANYGNVWVCDVDDQWHECTQAKLSVDATGSGRHRLDYAGGIEGDAFFMRNCGFFNETGRLGESFTRPSSPTRQPKIDFESLPRNPVEQ